MHPFEDLWIGRVTGRVKAELQTRLAHLYSDRVHSYGTFPWVSDTPQSWVEPPGPLSRYRARLLRMVRTIRSRDALAVERDYADGWRPRNVSWGDVVREKIAAIDWEPRLTFGLQPEHVSYAMKVAGLGRRKGVDLSTRSIAAVKPSNADANSGVLIRGQAVYCGRKGDLWTACTRGAMELADRLMTSGLNWGDIEKGIKSRDPWWAVRLLREPSAFFIPFLRTDENPSKPRLIFAGSGMFYVLEKLVTDPIMEDMKESLYFGFTPHRVMLGIGEAVSSPSFPGRCISADFSNWDLRVNAWAQYCSWRAWQELYHLPEPLMVGLAAYNIAAPLALPSDEGPYFQAKNGINPSGSGAFVPDNNLVNLTANVLAHLHLEDGFELWDFPTEPPGVHGQVYGDDTWWPTSVGVPLWASFMFDQLGMLVKPVGSGSLNSKNTVVMLRYLYSMFDDYKEPVIMSRARKALCPRIGLSAKLFARYTHRGRSSWRIENDYVKVRVALAYRAQSVEIKKALLDYGDRKKGYQDIWDYWKSAICPRKFLLLSLTDAELSREASALGLQAGLEDLSYACARAGVTDAQLLLKR